MDFPQGFFESRHRAKDSKPNFHRLWGMAFDDGEWTWLGGESEFYSAEFVLVNVLPKEGCV